MVSGKSSLLCLGLGWFPKSPGGLNRYVFGVLNSLSAESFLVELCAVDIPPVTQEVPFLVTELSNIPTSIPTRLVKIFQNFSQRQISRPSAINLHFALYGFPLLTRFPKNVPLTFTFHGPWAAEGEREIGKTFRYYAARWVEEYVYSRCDRFITLSQAFADILHRDYNIPTEKIHIIPGGINTQKFQANLTRQQARQQLNFPTDRPILFCPRRLVQRMGIDKLLQALVTVQQQIPNIWLAIAGRGPQREALEQQAQRLGLTDHVKFLGYVPDEDLPVCYQAADLTVVPSQALEGFGLILLESLASGTPVLSTPVGGMPEVLRPFDPNLITSDTSVEAIGDRILQLLNGDRSLPSRDACRAYAVENYDWQIIAPRVKQVLLMPKGA